MRIQAHALLASFAFAFPVLAQTESRPQEPEKNVEKLWRIEASGIGG